MRVAFIPSAYRTVFHHALGERLGADGHEVYWLSPNRRWAQWLVRRGVSEARILDITRWASDWRDGENPTPEQLRRLREVDAAGALRIRDIILMDPLLGRPGRHALKYLAVCALRIRDFLSEREIGIVLAEQTWAFELLAGQVCRELGIPYHAPHTVRFPDSRFGFFDGHLEATLIGVREVSGADRRAAAEHLLRFRESYSQPDYMRVNRSVLRADGGRIRLLTRHVLDLASDRFDETSRRPLGLIADHTRRLVRGKINLRRGRFADPPLPPERPFVFFPLHMQPEASIDIKGTPYSNQIEVVRAMTRTLPVTHDLYVKEHGIALTARSGRFYRELSRIPGVTLIDPRAGIHGLISATDLVVTVTGTAAYEAALLGRPSASIAPIFFDPVVRFPRFDPFRDSVADLLADAGSDLEAGQGSGVAEERLIEFLAWLISRSFPGTVGDSLWLPDSMSVENIERVADGFGALFEAYDRGATTSEGPPPGERSPP